MAVANQSTSDFKGVNLNVRMFGARGDGVTDDTPAIQAAVNAIAARGGGRMFMPTPSVAYLISVPVVVKPEVQLVGDGRRCYIRTSGGFPSDSYAVRLGDGTDYAFNTRLENCVIDCSRALRCGGVFSNNTQEQSGLRGVVVTGYNTYGAYFTGTGGNVANFLVEDCEFMAATEGGFNATAGLWVENSSWKVTVKNLSVVPHSRVANTAAGIKAANATLEVFAGHIEGHQDGILFDTDSHGGIYGLTGEANTRLVRINTGGRVTVFQVRRAGGTTDTIRDDRLSRTITDAAPLLYVTDGTDALYAADGVTHSDAPLQIGNGPRGSGDSLTINGSVARVSSDSTVYLVITDADGTTQRVVLQADAGTLALMLRNRAKGPIEFHTNDTKRGSVLANGNWEIDAALLVKGLLCAITGSAYPGSYNARTAASLENDNAAGSIVSILAALGKISALWFGQLSDGHQADAQITYDPVANTLTFTVGGGADNPLVLGSASVKAPAPGNASQCVLTTDASQTVKNKDLRDPSNTLPPQTLPDTGTPGTYTKVTTDSKGRVSSGATLADSDIPANSRPISTQSIVTGSRALTSVYQNTTGKPMKVAVTISVQGGFGISAYTDGSSSPSTIVASNAATYVTGSPSLPLLIIFEVLPGNYYKVTAGGSPTLTYWTEWY